MNKRKFKKIKSLYQFDIFIKGIIFKAMFLSLFFQSFTSKSSPCEDSLLSSEEATKQKQKISMEDVVSIPPVNPNDINLIRNGLKTKKNITGGITLAIEQPFDISIAEKLWKFLVNKDDPLMISATSLDEATANSTDAEWENILLQSEVLSPIEINTMRQGIVRYLRRIEQIILKMDKTPVIGSIAINTERQLEYLVAKGHHHLLDDVGWMTATHAVLGDGSWFEGIHHGKKQRIQVRNGETLLLSEIRRVFALSGRKLPHGTLHGAPPGKKRLVIVSDFNLTNQMENLFYMSELERISYSETHHRSGLLLFLEKILKKALIIK